MVSCVRVSFSQSIVRRSLQTSLLTDSYDRLEGARDHVEESALLEKKNQPCLRMTFELLFSLRIGSILPTFCDEHICSKMGINFVAMSSMM